VSSFLCWCWNSVGILVIALNKKYSIILTYWNIVLLPSSRFRFYDVRKRIKAFFFARTIYSSFLRRYNPRPFPVLFPCLQSEEERTSEKERILRKILSGCRLETGQEYFTRCIIWLDIPSFREIYDRASLRQTGLSVHSQALNVPQDFIPSSVIPVLLSSKYPCRRICGARGGTCP